MKYSLFYTYSVKITMAYPYSRQPLPNKLICMIQISAVNICLIIAVYGSWFKECRAILQYINYYTTITNPCTTTLI